MLAIIKQKSTLMKILSLLSILQLFSAVVSENLNVYGEELESCSSSGMALTGWTRNGDCVDYDEDSGSHHICVNLSSTTGGNFCEVTGQTDWCSSTNMQCHDKNSSAETECPVQNWCICQWAFAEYIRNAGGCNKIQSLVCKSINMRALQAYMNTPGFEDALACLAEQCGLRFHAE